MASQLSSDISAMSAVMLFKECMGKVKHAGYDQLSLSIMLLDIVHFKLVNERFGHGVGNGTVTLLSTEEFVANADKLLYQAKNSGRNKVVI